MSPAQFVDSVSRLSFENTFNPYSNRCGVHDVRDAPQLRSQTLLRVLEVAVALDVDSIWVGRDLGYRGGRRTGLAFTDDVHIDEYARRWGISVRQPTSGGTYAERTATVVWRVLSRIALPVFLWNVFPLHPHEPGNPFSNRLHNNVERKAGEQLLADVIGLLDPRRLIAIGNDAARVVSKIYAEREVVHVRHPSYGGQAVFASQMCELYNLDEGPMEPRHTLFDGCPELHAQVAVDRGMGRHEMTPGAACVESC